MANNKRKQADPVAALWATLAFLGCAVIFVLAIHMYAPPPAHVALNPANKAPAEGAARLYDPAHPAQRVRFGHTVYLPKGSPVQVPSQQITLVGQTREGYLLYARRSPVGGGGGHRSLYLQPEHALYLETRDGRYQPVVKR